MQINEMQASGFPYSLARVSSGALPLLKVVGDPQGPQERRNRKIRPDFVGVLEPLARGRRLVWGSTGHAGMHITYYIGQLALLEQSGFSVGQLVS